MSTKFTDTATGAIIDVSSAVTWTETNGVYSFSENGEPLTDWPTTYVPYVAPAPTAAELLLVAQQTQESIIDNSYNTAANASVTDASGNIWGGGAKNGELIYMAVELAQQNGATTVNLFDASDVVHSLTIAEGLAVAALIGTAFQTAYANRVSLRAQIKAATTVTAVQAIVW
jgi:hypothetical protein